MSPGKVAENRSCVISLASLPRIPGRLTASDGPGSVDLSDRGDSHRWAPGDPGAQPSLAKAIERSRMAP